MTHCYVEPDEQAIYTCGVWDSGITACPLYSIAALKFLAVER